MTGRPPARWARAVAVTGLAAGTLAVSATPGVAAPEPIRILSVSAENVQPGDTVRVRFRVTNPGPKAETAIVVVGGGLACKTGCRAEPMIGPGQSQDFETTLVAPKAYPGEISGLNISAAVRLGGQNSYDHRTVYVHGPSTSTPGPGRSTSSAGKPSATAVAPPSVSPAAQTGQPASPGASPAAAALSDLRAVSDEGGNPLLFAVPGGLLVVVCLGGFVVLRRRRSTPGEPAPTR